MSILDALKVQKADQKSIQQLAQLPQQMIIQMAQRGDIPAEVAPVVINEKARIAKEMANIQAMMAQRAQGAPPTVLEQAMNANAQAENPQPPAQPPMQGMPRQAPQPQMPEQQPGLAGLPTPPGTFNEQSFAGGGIVAFQPGGEVSLADLIGQSQRQDPSFAGMYGAQEGKGGRRYQSLADALQEYQALTKEYRTPSAEEEAFAEYLKGQKPRSKEEMEQQGWMRALEAGLGIMGGTSPYALANIGKGAEAAAKGYGEDVKEQRKREAAYLQSAAQQSRQKRLEGIEDVKQAQSMLEKDIDAEYKQKVLDKDTDWLRRYNGYLPKVMKDLGINDPENPEVKATTTRMVDASIGMAAAKIETTQSGIVSQNRREASNYVESRLSKQANPEALRMRRLEQEDRKKGTNTAEAYRNELFSEALGRISSGETLSGSLGTTKSTAQTQPAKGKTPPDLSTIKGVPPGSTIGKLTPEGWEVLNSKGKPIGHIKE